MKLEPRVAGIVRPAKLLDRSAGDVPTVRQRLASARTARQFGFVAMRHGPRTVQQEDLLVPVEGGRITVRLYRPAVQAAGPLPLHIFFHGHVHASFALTRLVPSAAAHERPAVAALAAALG